MFSNCVLAFGDAHDDNPGLGTKRKFGRTNEIPDVLYEDEPETSQLGSMKSLPNQICVRVAAVDRRNLNHRHTLSDKVGIAACRGITIENSNTDLIFKLRNKTPYQRGFPGANRPHNVNRGYAMEVQKRTVFFSQLGVSLKETVLQFNVVDFVGRSIDGLYHCTFLSLQTQKRRRCVHLVDHF